MLFLVPLLAGFLRPVRVSVDKANAAMNRVESSTEPVRDVARGAEALTDLGARLRDQLLTPATGDVAADGSVSAAERMDQAATWRIGTPILPRPWAMAFTAALLILLGDTVFQIWCPTPVKQNSLDEYIDERCQQFATHPSRTTLDSARHDVAQDPASSLIEWETSLTEQLKSQTEPSNDFLHSELQQVRTSIVEKASRMSYLRYAGQYRLATWSCFAIYTLATCIVLKILQEQTLNVIRSAGW